MKRLIVMFLLCLPLAAYATTPPNYGGLIQLQFFMAQHQAGNATLYTDGHGVYWVSRKTYNPTTGAPLPNVISKADVASAQAALPVLQAFLALVPNATVATNPFTSGSR